MLRRCYMVVIERNGKEEEVVFLEAAKAYDYAVKYHGWIVKMFGNDSPEEDTNADPQA